jgi:hypothetical protein
MKNTFGLFPLLICLFTASVLSAQGLQERDSVPLRNWDAPMYWQPSVVESKDAAARQMLTDNSRAYTASDITPTAQTPANSLVFVGMTPCRVVDTRTGSGFTGAFGPPSLIGTAVRTFPIQFSPQCSIPPIAQAYSFNITVVPPGFLDFITVWPTGQPRPNASTLNAYVGTVIANAAIMPAGTSGSVDVYASQNTHLIIDINGYYAQQSGITLAQGTAGAPSMSFTGDAGTGIYSSGPGTLNLATAGASRLTLRPDGDLDLVGNIRKNGSLFLHSVGAGNTGVGLASLAVNTGQGNTATGASALFSNTIGNGNTATGQSALVSNTSGSQNSAIGYSALANNTIGFDNTALGYNALGSNTTGRHNSASGRNALYSNTTGADNVALGYYALFSNTTGDENTAIGNNALNLNTTGFYNTAIGRLALANTTAGTHNTATGAFALGGTSTGTHNTAIGLSALGSNTTGLFNTAIGYSAGSGNVTGSSNTFIGVGASPSSGSLTNATSIGSNAVVNASDKIRLGNAFVTVLESQVGLTVVSDKNAKENFRPVDAEAVLEKVAGLAVSSWNYVGHDSKEFRHYGPVSQDFFAAFGQDEVGRIGSPTTINSSDVSGILMLAVQALEKRSKDLQMENEKLKGENRRLEHRLLRLEAVLDIEP